MEIKIQISNTERVILKYIEENLILISVEEDLSGITRKLAYFDLKKKTYTGYNSHNFNIWFKLCKKHSNIKPKLIRFITSMDGNIISEDIKQIKKTFTCFKRRINITINKMTQKAKNDFEGIKDIVIESFN